MFCLDSLLLNQGVEHLQIHGQVVLDKTGGLLDGLVRLDRGQVLYRGHVLGKTGGGLLVL